MYSQTRLKKSEFSLAGLETLLGRERGKRLRSSFDGSAVSPIRVDNYRVTISHQQIPLLHIPAVEKEEKQGKNLRDQLSSLQEKLNKAKKEMSVRVTNQDRKQKQPQLQGKQSLFLKNKIASERVLAANYVPQETQRKSRKQQFISYHPKPNNITTFSINPYSSLKNNQYYLAEVVRARHQKNSLAVEHINTSISLLKQCQDIEKIIQNQHSPILLPHRKDSRKTLFIDLDETLIHCLDNTECEPDLKLKVMIEGEEVDLDILIRPYALTFLKKVSKKWEVVVFTASHKNYADAILNEIDPDGEVFHHRLYRQHCIHIDDLYIKDLARVNRELGRVVLVDNAAYSYCLQLDNGIPILPYYDGKDFELSALEGYLSHLEKVEDVRVVNQQYFKLNRYSSFGNSSDLIEELYHSKTPFIL